MNTTVAVLLNGEFSPLGFSPVLLKPRGLTEKQRANRKASGVLRNNSLPLKHSIKSRMRFFRISNPYFRIPATVVAALVIRLLLDTGFSTAYRFHSIIRPLPEYLSAILLTVLMAELVYFLKSRLNKRVLWEKGPGRRLLIELLVNSLLLLPVFIAGRILLNIYVVNSQFIKLSDEVITAIYYMTLLVAIPAFTEFSLFLINRYRTGLAEVEKFRKENIEFQFETLRTQVNPHFLFNSLNTLSSLVYEDQAKAVEFIRHMSDVYRYSLENRNQETITLRSEINFIRAFVYLYELRFDKKLKVEISISDKALDKRIAPMTLQLLVENAVKHNIVSTRRPLQINISDHLAETISVSNNLQRKPAGVESTAVGLKNIVSRYSFLSDKAVEITETENEYRVSLPLI